MKIQYDKDFPIEDVRNGILNNILKSYPFIESGILTKSLCGRTIPIVSIGNLKNRVLLVGAFHGMEWLTSLILLKFLDELGEAIQLNRRFFNLDVSRHLNNVGVAIIPCINPDGVEISLTGFSCAKQYSEIIKKISGGDTKFWQANARGVDLNHNFDADWQQLHDLEIKNGITQPSPTRYGGEYPESEPETQALTKLCRENYFSKAIAFHSQGEEIYWQYGQNTHRFSKNIANIFSEVSGYKVANPEGLAVGGGFKDWFIVEFCRPAFTIEIGKGKNPLPLSDFKPVYNKIRKLLLYSLIL